MTAVGRQRRAGRRQGPVPAVRERLVEDRLDLRPVHTRRPTLAATPREVPSWPPPDPSCRPPVLSGRGSRVRRPRRAPHRMLASARGHRPPPVGSRAATQHRAGVSEPVRILASLEPNV